MTDALLIAYGATLLTGVLLSGLAGRSVLSTAVLFLVAGAALGPAGLDVIRVAPDDPGLTRFTEVALFVVLFTEGMHVDATRASRTWHLPGRALLVGMPLTLVAIALLAHAVVGLSWPQAALLGAVLSPTDPIFAAALVSHRAVPGRLRNLLNVESGMNDGLALPVIVVILGMMAPSPAPQWLVVGELPLGVGIGIGVAWLALRLERSRFFAATKLYQPINAVAIAILVFGVARLTGGNEFLGAFAAGIVTASHGPAVRCAFAPLGDVVTELLKLSGVMLLGALVTPALLEELSWGAYVFVALVLVAVRPAALAIALAGSDLSRLEWIAAAWFGPRGFASVFYGLLVLQSGIPDASSLFHLIAVVVAISIVVHSSTDVAIVGWFAPASRGARRPSDERISDASEAPASRSRA